MSKVRLFGTTHRRSDSSLSTSLSEEVSSSSQFKSTSRQMCWKCLPDESKEKKGDTRSLKHVSCLRQPKDKKERKSAFSQTRQRQ